MDTSRYYPDQHDGGIIGGLEDSVLLNESAWAVIQPIWSIRNGLDTYFNFLAMTE